MNFGDILKKLRKDKNLTQDELAQKINSSRSNIANYENGKNMPSVEILQKLSELFDVSTDYLLGKSDQRNPEKVNIEEVDVAFSSGYKGLNDTNKMIIQNTLEALLAKQEKEKKDKENKEKNK